MGEIRDSIKKNLGYYLSLSGISQKEFAKKLGVSQSSVTCWLKGKNSPDIEMVARICDVLDISVVDLFGMDHIEQYSELEKLIIKQYRANPQMQSAVDRLLGIEETKVEKLPDRPTIKMSAAAHGGASTSQELTPEEYENWIKIRDGEMPE